MTVPPGLENGQRRHHALDRLVVGGVQRIAGAAGDDDIDRLGHGVGRNAAGELAPRKKAASMSPATTERTCRRSSMTALRMKSQPAMRPIRVFSSWTGLPARQPARALGCSRNSGPCQTLIVSRAARPGQISFRPPEKPAMKCGSIRPDGDLQVGRYVAGIDPRRHAAGRLAQEGMRGEVPPHVVLDAVVLEQSPGRPSRSSSWRVLGRCRPVATRIRILVGPDAGRLERGQQRRQQQAVGNRAGHVANGDAGVRGGRGPTRPATACPAARPTTARPHPSRSASGSAG